MLKSLALTWQEVIDESAKLRAGVIACLECWFPNGTITISSAERRDLLSMMIAAQSAGFTVGQIATFTGIPYATVRTWLKRASVKRRQPHGSTIVVKHRTHGGKPI